MNKLLSSVLIFGTLFFGGLTVQAETTEQQVIEVTEEIEVGAGINADSPFYFLDKGFENLQLWLTRDDSKEAEILLKLAEERMSELNSLPKDKVAKFVDELADEYSNNVNQANARINKLILENKLSEEVKLKLQERLNHVADIDQALKDTVKEKISTEVQDKIKEIKNNTYLTALASGLSNEEIKTLKEQGYGYGEILKINALAKITGKTTDELKLLDIFNESGNIDFDKVASELIVSIDDVMNLIKEYRDTVKDEIRSQVKEKKDEIEERIKERQEEIKQEIEDEINERLEERKSQIEAIMTNHINLHVAVLDLLVSEDIITRSDEQLILDQINIIKESVLSKIETNEINRNDYEQMRLEITKFIKTTLQEQLVVIDITQLDTTNLTEEAKIILGLLLDNPEELIDNVLNKILTNLETKGVYLTDEQIENIKTKISENINNRAFNDDNYNDILEHVSNIIYEQMGRNHSDLFDNLNEFKERYQDSQEDDEDVSYEQEILDLFNSTITNMNLEEWTNLSLERQNKLRNEILSNIDFNLTQDELVTDIENRINEALVNLTPDETSNDQIDLFNQLTKDFPIWNILREERKIELREEILSSIDSNLSQDELRTQINDLLLETLSGRDSNRHND